MTQHILITINISATILCSMKLYSANFLLLILVGFLIGVGIYNLKKNKQAGEEVPEKTTETEEKESSKTALTATFAGGCFWCIEPAYQETEGIIDAINGYAGGTESDASYKQVAKGQTKHREAVQVTYDPTKITYAELVEIFWRQIDPTDDGGQFTDRGFQYTTAIFYYNDGQKQVAEESKESLEKSTKFDKPIATQILPFSTFYPAEEYHQDYYKKVPIKATTSDSINSLTTR